ncbi:MAG: glycosyltransferase family 39 protein [Candidatus Omnitrophica bacterium]|nr:glycosyltransferase family 39 protein [Candidatus Omnitrophota bacterium]
MNISIFKNKSFILIILVVTLISLRLTLLTTTFKYTWCEEGVRGIFAKHILDGTRTQSIFDYFQPYQGGSIIVSILAVPFFWLFGVSIFSLRLVPLCFSVGILILLFLFMDKFFNRKAAILASILYIFSPISYTQYSMYCIGNHHSILLFNILTMFIFFKIFFDIGQYYESKRCGYFMLLGLVSGFSMYFCFSSLIFLFSILLIWYIFDKLFFLRKKFIIFIVFFGLGNLLLIYYTVCHYGTLLKDDWYNPLLYLTRADSLWRLDILEMVFRIKDLFSHRLADSFNFDYFGNYSIGRFYNYFYYFVFIFSFVYILWLNRKYFIKIIRGVLPLKRFDVRPEKISLESLLILFPLLYIIIYCASEFSSDFLWRGRYAIPLYLFCYIFISLFITRLFSHKIIQKALLIVIGTTVILISVFSNLNLIGKEDAWIGKGLDEVIYFLQTKNIRHVYIDYNTKWPLAFKSREQIIPSCRGIWGCDAEGKTIFNDCKEGEQYREYEKMVDNAVSYAYVLTKQHKFGYIEIMEDYLKENQLKYKKGILGCHVIYYDFSKDVRPEDIDFAEEWRQRNL